MNIKEIEERSGLPRSGIRFYESEGLLHPERRQNGYRDYSETDLETLLKIKRLRALGLSVAEIRAVQSGESSLASELNAALRRLGEQRGGLAGAEAQCRALLGAGTGWENLLDAPEPRPVEARQSGGSAVSGGSIKYGGAARTRPGAPDWWHGLRSPGPWRRFFARCIDGLIYSVPIAALTVLVFRINPGSESFGGKVLDWLLGAAALLIAEPLCLHFFGATPGKWLLGISVRGWDGEKLSVREAFSRTFKVFVYGMGIGIPIASLVTYILAYRRELLDRDQPWDAEYGRWIITCVPKGAAVTAVGSVSACAAAFLLVFLVVTVGSMPQQQGWDSAQSFADNYNDLAAYYDIGSEYELMTAGGLEDVTPSNVAVVDLGDGGSMPEFEFTESGGRLTRVEFTAGRGEGEGFVSTYRNYMTLAVMSYVWGRGGCGAFDFGARQTTLDELNSHTLEPFEAEWGGVRVECSVSYSGYEENNFGLWPVEGEVQEFELRFTMEEAG